MCLKNKLIFYVFIIVIILKLISINLVQKNRELPIEIDDSFIYMTHAFLIYEDEFRSGKTWQSIKDFIFSTYENDKINISDGINEIGKIEKVATTPRYFLYSKLFGFLEKYIELDNVKIWWIFNYFSQILIIISFYCLIELFLKKIQISHKIILLIASFFLVLSIKHHILATPMTFGNSLYIISLYLILRSNYKIIKLTGFVVSFVSLHFHPGVFLISTIFIGSFFFLSRKRFYLKKFFLLLLPFLLALCIEQLLFFYDGTRYLGLFETNYKSQELSRSGGLMNIFDHNWTATKKIFYGMLYPSVPFFFHDKLIVIVIYFYSIFVSYKNNRHLFILNILSICCVIVSNFYFISVSHKGNLIYYIGQTTALISLITIYNLYFEIDKRIKKKFKLKKQIFLIFIVSIIFINNSINYFKILKHRTYDDNYENIIFELIEFKKDIINNSEDGLIIGDHKSLFIFTSQFYNTNIYLSDKMRKNNKIWHYKNKHNIKGYVGLISNTNIETKTVYVSGEKFIFKNIKKFNDFCFLYN